MTNPPHTSDSSTTPTTQVQGVTEIRQKTIAALIARGFSVKDVAKKIKMSESRIYHLLSDKDSFVNAEMNRILNELFSAGDRRLINLYDKALQKMDSMLSSSDQEKQFKAIDRIIKIYLTRSAKNAVTIQQYFGIQTQEEKEGQPETLDELILRKRKERELPEFWEDHLEDIILEVRRERGLPKLPDDYIQDIISKVLKERGLPELLDNKDSSHSTPKPSAHSSQENSTPDNSPQDAPPKEASPRHSIPEDVKAFAQEIISK